MAIPAIQTIGITKRYGSKNVVDGVSLTINQGEIFSILGPNGAGKTTLLRMLSTQLPMDGGTASIFNYDVSEQPEQVRRIIGMTGQFTTIDNDLTAMENMEIIGRLNGLSRKRALSRADELLEQFSLTNVKAKELSAFSGGMRRRLDLASSLMTHPRLIILDEPTTGLDPITRNEMWNTIRQLVNEGSTVLLTTQYLEEADQLADHIAIIRNGKVMAQGTPDDLKNLIGDTHLEIRYDNKHQMRDAQRIISGHLPSTHISRSSESDTLILNMKESTDMLDLLNHLHNLNLTPDEFSTSKPSLDDVFVRIVSQDTGKADKAIGK
ncbi:ATP-binding cassette domain-containing protein [Bifidobacterium dentium]|uniref:ATP-binding cassette domain-containing protein n=1 Tax=Bifidobacterium dentium TaxID=1689 RepID=UPI0018B0E633|nr:ATP-binding cassette domain-containing protein [Bifidobacterium dentium]MBF9692018.1 ATP-binding cassette domain-containing protein [Bifidobacterium dentium]MBF9698187.1 ATP-binding cassette domain-containing protein [Bifidobacterium dentium]